MLDVWKPGPGRFREVPSRRPLWFGLEHRAHTLTLLAASHCSFQFESALDSPQIEGGAGPPIPTAPRELVATGGRSDLVPH
eukprot:6326624-Prymnesium_polylepis.1